jgi:hypothetical protein
MLLPLAENLLTGEQPPDWVQGVFLGATLAVGIVNYLPTRLGPAAVLLGLGCAWETLSLLTPNLLLGGTEPFGWLALSSAPWAAWAGWKVRRRCESSLDRLWEDFRDRFGLVWGQRLREQFNRAAANAGWPVYLAWGGFTATAGAGPPNESLQGPLVETLGALLKRFL